MLKIPELFPRRCHACAQSLPDSQQVDPQAWALWKEDTFMHNVELSDRQDFPQSSRNPDRKNVLQRTKNTPAPPLVGPYFSSPSSASREPRTLKERVAQAFRRYQEHRNPTLGARSNMCVNTDKKQGKMSRRFGTFFSWTAAFARRVFPTR